MNRSAEPAKPATKFATAIRKYGVTEDQCIELRSAMINTWQAIASDCLDAAADDKRAYNAMVEEKPGIIAELTLDAGRYRDYGGQPLEWLGLWMAAGGDLLKLGAAVWKA